MATTLTLGLLSLIVFRVHKEGSVLLIPRTDKDAQTNYTNRNHMYQDQEYRVVPATEGGAMRAAMRGITTWKGLFMSATFHVKLIPDNKDKDAAEGGLGGGPQLSSGDLLEADQELQLAAAKQQQDGGEQPRGALSARPAVAADPDSSHAAGSGDADQSQVAADRDDNFELEITV